MEMESVIVDNEKQSEGKRPITFSINRVIVEKYQLLCRAYGLVMSKRIENFIIDDIKKIGMAYKK